MFGKNTKLPFTFNNKPSALIQHDTSKILTDNLTALYKTKTSIYFKQIIRENTKSFKQQWTNKWSHQIHTRDSAYFKKINEKRCRVPGKFLGKDKQQVLVKYDSNYVRVHPYRLLLARNAYNILNPNAVQKFTGASKIRDKHNSHIILEKKSPNKIARVTMI